MLLYSYHDSGLIPEEAELLKLLKKADVETAKTKKAAAQGEVLVLSN
jgi:hypothetical protein